MKLLRKAFSVRNMIKPEHLCGELPTSKEAYHSLLVIAIPSIIEMVFVSLIGSVDVVMVGRLGFEAIAAVGLVGQPRFLMLSLFFALNVGVTAIVARRKGEDLPGEASLALRNTLVLVSMMTVVIMAVTLVFSRHILLFAGAEADTIDMAEEYFRIMIYFLPVNTLTMSINAAQRGVGDTRVTMYANLAANIVNVVFDYLLIYGNFGFPRLGVAGDAWASGIGFCVGLVISVAAIFSGKGGSHFLRISLKDDWRLHKETVKSLLKIGGNSAIEQIAQRVGFFIYAIIIAKLGTAAFAAHQVAMQFLGFSFNFGNGLATAAVALVGQMLGRKRADLATVYGKCAQRLALLMSIGLASSIILFRGPLVSIFLDGGDPANLLTIDIAVTLMLVVAMFQPPQTSTVVFAGCLRGAGDNLFVAVTMIICVAVVRPVISLVAVYVFSFGIIGAWTASLIDICLRFALVYYRFSGTKWHYIRV